MVLPEDAEYFLSQMDIAKFMGRKEDSGAATRWGLYWRGSLAIPRWPWSIDLGVGYDLFEGARDSTVCQESSYPQVDRKERTTASSSIRRWYCRRNCQSVHGVAPIAGKNTASEKTLVLKSAPGDLPPDQANDIDGANARCWAHQSFSTSHFSRNRIDKYRIRLLGVTMTNFVDHTGTALVEEKKTTSLFTEVVFSDVKSVAISSSV